MGSEIAVVWGRTGPGFKLAGALAAARDFSSAQDVEVQLFDAVSVVSSDHLLSAAAHAIRARERKTMRSGSLAVEMLLYAAGRRQIREAMALLGLRDETRDVAAVIVGPKAAALAPKLLAAIGCVPVSEKEAADGSRALGRLGISAAGATDDQLADLVLEQVALLDIEK